MLAFALALTGCGGGGGDGRDQSSPTVPATSPPPQATGLTATAGDREVTLSWTAIAAATRWEYRQRVGDGAWGTWTTVADGGSATTGHTVTDLETGTAYGFQVRAGNAGGTGPASAEATATTIPAAPVGLTAKGGDRLVELAWTALGEASGWEFRMREEDGTWGAWTDVPDSGPATTGHSVRHLESGTTYGFQIRAVNATGAGPASTTATAKPVPEVPVDIPDANLRRVLEGALGLPSGETITDVDLRTLSEISAARARIAGLTGLEHATGLESVDLAENNIEDVEALALLTSLARLELQGNFVSDLSPLSTLESLTYVDLSRNGVADISHISALRSLDHLVLSYNDVVDVQPLSNLTSLRRLELDGNEVSDLTPLSELTSLVHLELWSNSVTDLTPLGGLTELTHLGVGSNRVADIRPLTGLTSLLNLRLLYNRIVDISALRGLHSLEELTLGPNPVADLAPLEALTSLRYLYLAHVSAVEDLSFVSGMLAMEDLYLFGTSVEDLSPLGSLANLAKLQIGGTAVSDLSPLASLTSLRQLGIHDLSVDLRPLAKLTSLERIWQTNWTTRGDRPKVDIEPLSGLVNLTVLSVSPTHGDLSPLADLDSLVWLHVREPGTPFENLPTLTMGGGRLEQLTLDYGGLADISSLAEVATLLELNLAGNRIEDLSALGGLERLTSLYLEDNRIDDIAALAANPGLGEGDTISITGNPLGSEAILTHIPELESRGVTVAYDRDDFPGSALRILHDEAVSMRVEADLDAVTWDLDLTAYAAEFISHFGDEFDVLLFLSALPSASDHAALPYYGVYHHVSSDVDGIGLGDVDEPLGNATRLKGVIHFPYLRALAHGPALHELMHMWANYGVQTADDAHWGFSSAAGQLGGFHRVNLVDLGNGLWSAGGFATNANGGNSVRYSPWELYLGGFIGPEEVPELWVAAEGRWTGERTEAGHSIFEATEHTVLTVDEFVATHGAREPDHFDAPKELRGAVIVLEDDDHQLHHWDDLLAQVRWLSHPGPHESFEDVYNYHEATGGRGSLVLDGLRELRLESPSGAPSLRLEQVCPPPGAPTGGAASLLSVPWADGARPNLNFDGGRDPQSGR